MLPAQWYGSDRSVVWCCQLSGTVVIAQWYGGDSSVVRW